MHFLSFILLTLFSNAIMAPSESLRVVLDITRGVQRGCVYQGVQELHCFPISGGRNQAQTYQSALGRVRYCSFTTTGRELIPVLAQRTRFSEAFNSGLDYFISYDEARGVGTHTGDTSGYSGSCIRVEREDARFLYDLVRANSVMLEERILSTNVRYDVIDNTPGAQEAECDCVSNHLKFSSAHKDRAERICSGTLTAQQIFEEGQATLTPVDTTPDVIRPKPRPADLMATELAPRTSVRPRARIKNH